jgi:DNA-binding transcriptional regulator LsrR (DeoR family)
MSRQDEMRLMVKVARMYCGLGIRKQEIAERLSIYQSMISRLLMRAREANIVRICVSMPSAAHFVASGSTC